MVQVSNPQLKESRHVAIKGLPIHMSEDAVKQFFVRFGPVQRVTRHRDAAIIFVSFEETRSAAAALKADHIGAAPFKISYYNPEMTQRSLFGNTSSVSSTPSSHRSSSPQQPMSPAYRASTSEDVGSPHRHSEPSTSTAAPRKPEKKYHVPTLKIFPRDWWDPPVFTNLPGTVHDKLLAIAIFDISVKDTTPEKHVFDAVKNFVKRTGVAFHIDLENTLDPRSKKAKVFYTRLDIERLKKDRGNLLDGPVRFRIYYPPCQVENEPTLDAPSTSRCSNIEIARPERMHKFFASVHVPNSDKQRDTYFRDRFAIYGEIIDINYTEQFQGRKSEFAVVQFATAYEAENALRDQEPPKPMVAPSLPSKRLIIFDLPPLSPTMSRSVILYNLRACSARVYNINVDWIANRAIIGFEHYEECHDTFKRMKAGINFMHRIVPVDYCSDKLNEWFCRAKRKLLDFTKEAAAKTDPQNKSRRRKKKKRALNENGEPVSSSSEESGSEPEEDVSYAEIEQLTYDVDYVYSGDKEDVVPCRFDSVVLSADDPMEPSTSTYTRNSQNRRSSVSSNPGGSSYSYQYDDYFRDDVLHREPSVELPDNSTSRLLHRVKWKPFDFGSNFSKRVDSLDERNRQLRTVYEKETGRKFPKFSKEEILRTTNTLNVLPSHENHAEHPANDLEAKMKEWKRLSEVGELDEWKSDVKELLKVDGVTVPSTSSGVRSVRPSLDETRVHRISFDSSHHMPHHEMAQRSQSLSVGPMTPITPFHSAHHPLLVNTSQPSTSSQSAAALSTPRTSHPAPLQPSPVSRHGSMSSSTGRPASIQGLRHHSVIFPPDISIPPPPIPPTQDELISCTPPARRSSETLTPMKSPPFGKIQQLMSMPLQPPPGMVSGASSTTSTPRHSISGPNFEKSLSQQNLQNMAQNAAPNAMSSSQNTSKPHRPEKIQVRHDSISKPGPSSAASALQSRSQSMSASKPQTPVVRDAGSDLIEQIMSNTPSMNFKRLPKIEKKSSALQHLHNQHPSQHQLPGPGPSTPSTSSMLFKDKEKEKERRRREKEAEREREARKEMKRKETKEERHKRKEMERAKREEEERRERKREKQRLREKEERKREKEKEKERRRAEKEKKRKRRNESGEEATSSDEEPSKREMTQEEKDHQLAVILSGGSIIDSLKSRRRTDKEKDKSKRGNDSFEKLRAKNQDPVKRRVLIESSDEDKGSSGDDSTFLPPPPIPPTLKHKEREKGELSSSDDDESQQQSEHHHREHKKENRKRQKSLSNYSSDDHASKRKRQDSEEVQQLRKKTWEKEEQKARKRKLEHRKSSEDDRNKAKRDFRDVPLEDVSDEEEVENPDNRKRRPSASSTSSQKEHKEHKEHKEKPKTPLRVKTPSGTPMMSPKILSPKILSPKVSTSSTGSGNHKRPSVPDVEPLTSPRIRTTSSTSTTSSRNEAVVPEKPPTAKSSVSSMDGDLNAHEFSATNSPMSATGRPMVLTKAAMKTYHSSPPKKPSNSSSFPHESSTSSDDDESTSDASSSDSDEETSAPAPAAPPAAPPAATPAAPEVLPPAPEATKIVEMVPPPPPPPVLPPVLPPVVPAVLPVSAPEPQPEPEPEPEKVEEKVVEEPKVDDKQLEVVEEPKELEKEATDEPALQNSEDVVPPKPVEPLMKAPAIVQKLVEPEKCENPKFQSLISDQEQNSAVQSIFDDDEEIEEPQYPDHYTMAKERKSSSGSEPATAHNGPSTSYQNGPLVLEEDMEVGGEQEIVEVDEDDDDDIVEILQPVKPAALPPPAPPTAPPTLPAAPPPAQPSAQPPTQPPTQPAASLPSPLPPAPLPSAAPPVVPVAEPDPEPMPELIEAQAPIQKPLEVSVNSHRQVIQPSPRPAAPAANDTSSQSSQPVSVVQQPPRPSPSMTQSIATILANLPPEAQKDLSPELLQALIQSANGQLPNDMAQQLATMNSTRQKTHAEHMKSADEARRRQAAEAERLERERRMEVVANRHEQGIQNAQHFLSVDAMNIMRKLQQQQLNGGMTNGIQSRPSTSSAPHLAAPVSIAPGAPSLCAPSTSAACAPSPIAPIAPIAPVAPIPVAPVPVAPVPVAPIAPTPAIPIEQLQRRRTWFYKNFPCIWSGVLAIKSNVVRVKLHFVNGNAEFLKTALGRRGALQRDGVKITQRLRLDNGQVEHLHRVLTDPQYACCVAFVESTSPDELTNFEGVLQTSFIEYLKTKNIAGISSLPPTEVLGGARVHVFPPGELVDKYFAELAPALYNYLFEQNTKYLFIAFTDDKTMPNMMQAPAALTVEPPPC